MKKIILPTDFSENAEHAAEFALQMAARFGASITMLHAFYPATELNTGFSIDPNIETRRRDLLTQKVAKWQDKALALNVDPVPPISSQFSIGFPIEEILEASQEEGSFIVMGSTGRSGVLGRMFGSVSSQVAQRAKCPVLLVPASAANYEFSQILYACDGETIDRHLEQRVLDWVSIFDPVMHLIHVDPDDDKHQAPLQEIFQNAPLRKVVRVNIASPAVVESLNQYAANHDIDLLILASRKKSFWDQLLHISVTREMALHPSLPILVFHETAK